MRSFLLWNKTRIGSFASKLGRRKPFTALGHNRKIGIKGAKVPLFKAVMFGGVMAGDISGGLLYGFFYVYPPPLLGWKYWPGRGRGLDFP